MALSQADIKLVRRGWATAVAASDQTAEAFYARLFQIAPETRPLFSSDMELQGRKLVATLDFIVDHLDELDTLIPAAEDLAVRHVAYGVTADHYAFVGTALVDTLHALLGAEFDDAQASAWVRVYGILSDQMKAKAYPAAS